MPELANRYDRNAVQVLINGLLVGYLPREDAARYQQMLGDILRDGSSPRVSVRVWGRWTSTMTMTRPTAVVWSACRHPAAGDLADATGLTSGFGDALAVAGRRSGGHDPGRVALDLAVTIADGGRAITDLGMLRAQPELFGPVASGPTAWQALEMIDAAALGRLRAARAAGRVAAWAQLCETRGGLPQLPQAVTCPAWY